jgi:hypothetical protein
MHLSRGTLELEAKRERRDMSAYGAVPRGAFAPRAQARRVRGFEILHIEPTIALGIGKLVPPGRAIEVCPSAHFDAIATLDAGASIDLRGASMGLDFGLTTEESPSDFALACAGVDAHGHGAGDVESGLYYRVGSSRVDGTIDCP